MAKNQLALRFTGAEDLKPQVLRARELAEVIETLEAAIVAAVTAQDPAIKREQIVVPLVAISDASIGLAFAPNLPALTYPAARRIATALAAEQFVGLPETVLTPLRTLVRFVRQHGCMAELKVTHDDESIVAAITAATRIVTFAPVDGETVLYGEVIRAGGVEPRVELKPVAGRTLYCATTSEIAVQLANRLYQQVGVFGYATWDQERLEIKEFRILRVLPYNKTPLSQAFKLLREAAQKEFDVIEDVDQYVTTVRYGEDAG